MLHLVFGIFLAFEFASIVQAQTRPQCTAAALTQNCSVFNKYGSQPMITLDDGTSFQNPLVPMMPGAQGVDPEMPQEGGQASPNDEMAEVEAEDMLLQKKIVDLWNRMPSQAKVSSRFKADFNSLMPLPDKLLIWAGTKLVYPPGMRPVSVDRISITWPPNDSNARRQTIGVEELVQYMKTLPKLERQQMRFLLKSRATMKVAMLNGPENAPGRQEMPTPSKAQADTFNGLFNFSKQALLDEVLKGRDFSALSKEEKSAYARVKSVEFAGLDSKEPACAKMGGTAFYRSKTHKFIICQAFAHLPKSQIVRIMAHEIAHSIDPCMSRLPLVKINRSALAKLSPSPSEWPDEIRANPDLANAVGGLIQAKESKMMTYEHLLEYLNPKVYETMKKLGYLEEISPAIGEGKDPYRETYVCLRDKGKFNEVADNDLENIAKKFTDRYEDSTGLKVDRSKFLADTKSRLKPYSQCLQVAGHQTHMCEVMSDAWGAKVVGKWLTENPPKTEIEKISSFAWDLTQLCNPRALAASGESKDVPVLAVATTASLAASEPHPTSRKRTDAVLLSDPRVQKALGCTPEPELDCLAKFGTNGRVTGGERTQPKGTSNGSETSR